MASSRTPNRSARRRTYSPWRTGFDTVERVEALEVEVQELYRELNVSAQA